jgi:hypothetical protein
MTSGGTASQQAISVVNNGPPQRKWNLVVLGDGYQEDDQNQVHELDDFHRHVDDFADTLRATRPFDANWSAINVYRIDVISSDSGADDPAECAGGTGANPTTYFDATFCSPWGTQRVDRLLTVNASKAKYIAKNRLPQTHQVLVIVNSTKYGGSGWVGVAVCSVAPQAFRVAIHEMGHSGFSLDDEYEEPGFAAPASEPLQPNITISTSRANAKWGDLIQPATLVPSSRNPGCGSFAAVAEAPAGAVGAFEGGGHSACGMFRPAARCRMRDYDDPFCSVCERVIDLTLRTFL